MTSEEAFEILKEIKHAKELTRGLSMYGKICKERTTDKEIEALETVIKLKEKIKYKIEMLEKELNNISNKKRYKAIRSR